MNPFRYLFVTLSLLITLGLFGLPDLSAREAAARSVLFSPASRFQLSCRLTITDSTGDQKVRELLLTSLRTATEDRFLAQVTAPTYLRNLKFLRIQTKDGIGTWLKTAGGIQRVAPGADPEPLFGSDFTTLDFQPGSQEWVTSPKSGGGLIVLERPADPRWGWSRQELTLREDLLVVKSEFFNPAGVVVRRYEAKNFGATGRPERLVLEDLKNARRSELEILSFDEAKPITASLFTPGSL